MSVRGSRFQHAAVWTAIDDLADQAGLSASGLAKRCGLDPTIFNPSKRLDARGNCRWPSMETVTSVLDVTGTNFTEFGALVDRIIAEMRQTPTWAMPKVASVA